MIVAKEETDKETLIGWDSEIGTNERESVGCYALKKQKGRKLSFER